MLTTDASARPLVAEAPAADPAAHLAPVPADVLERMTDAFFALDASWRFTYLNSAAERLLERSRGELLGRVVWQEFPEAVGSEFQRQYELARATGEMVSFVSFYAPLDCWFSVRAYPDAGDNLTVYFQDATEHERMRVQTEATANRFRRMVDANITGVVIGQGEYLVEANDAFLQMLGYPREAIAARRLTWPGITPPGFEDVDNRSLEELRTHGAAQPFEKEYVRADGTRVPVLVVVALLDLTVPFDPDTFSWVAQLVDLSHRKELERALHASEERLRWALEASSSGTFIWYVDEDRTEADARMLQLFGLTSETALTLAQALATMIHPDDRERYAAAVAQATDAQGTGELREDIRVILPDSSQHWLAITAQIISGAPTELRRLAGTAVDITERKRAEELAEERARQLTAMLDTMGDGVVLLGPGGEIVRTNPAYDRLLDLTSSSDLRDAYLRGTLAERGALLHLADARGRLLPTEAWPTPRVLRGEMFAGSEALDLRLTDVAGREVVVSVSGVPMRDEKGHIIGGVLVFRDMTDRYNREQERSETLHVVAHELRTPVTSLKALVQINQRRVARGAPVKPEQLETEARAVGRMERLVNDLLDTARAETAQLELDLALADVAALCEQVASEQMAASGRGITLDLPTTPVMAEVDSGRIAQVVGNLLSNALKYSPAEADVTLQLRAQGADTVISVQDTGPGIPKHALTRLFERFYRAPGVKVLHGSGVGLGVGLYLCKQIVERHGGTIAVKSRPGQGTTFTVRLPLLETGA